MGPAGSAPSREPPKWRPPQLATRWRTSFGNARYRWLRSRSDSGFSSAWPGGGKAREADLALAERGRCGNSSDLVAGDPPLPCRNDSASPTLNDAEQGEDKDDNKDCPKSPGRVVAPSRAIRPSGQRAEQQNNHDDEDDKTHFRLCLAQPMRWGAPTTLKSLKCSRAGGSFQKRAR
jgi:hypothetical protein